jgi:hypothetical protein
VPNNNKNRRNSFQRSAPRSIALPNSTKKRSFQERCRYAIDQIMSFRGGTVKGIDISKLLNGTFPTMAQSMIVPSATASNTHQNTLHRPKTSTITLSTIREKIPERYQGNVDAFVRDIRDLFGITYWKCPPRSTERSVVLTISRMFDSRLLVGLRGPRVSPRQISRGYQTPTQKKKKEVYVPSFRRVVSFEGDDKDEKKNDICFMRPVSFIRFESVRGSYVETKEELDSRRVYVFFRSRAKLSLSLFSQKNSRTHTHTHTDTQRNVIFSTPYQTFVFQILLLLLLQRLLLLLLLLLLLKIKRKKERDYRH